MQNHILNEDVEYKVDHNNHLIIDEQTGLYSPAGNWDPRRKLFTDEKVRGYEATMDLWQALWRKKGALNMKRLVSGKTEQMVGVSVSLNGYPRHDDEIFQNQTIIDSEHSSRPFYVREVILRHNLTKLIKIQYADKKNRTELRTNAGIMKAKIVMHLISDKNRELDVDTYKYLADIIRAHDGHFDWQETCRDIELDTIRCHDSKWSGKSISLKILLKIYC